MRKIVTTLLLLYGGLAAAQQGLAIRAVVSFPSHIINGSGYTLSLYIRNESNSSFSGKVDVLMAVNNGVPFLLANDFDVLLALGHPLAPGDSVLWSTHGYIFPTAAFTGGVNDILIWPESPTLGTAGKYRSTVIFTTSAVVVRNRNLNPKMNLGNDADRDAVQTGGTTEIRVYPNPAAEKIYIDGNAGNRPVRVFSPDGRELASFPNGASQIQIGDYSPGYYVIKVGNDTENPEVHTFIKQ